MDYQNLKNKRFGSWTVIRPLARGPDSKTKLLCRCDCGEVRAVDAYSLLHGLTKSCGKCKTVLPEGEYMRCVMKNGASFLFDAEDEALIRAHSWSTARGRVRTTIGGKQVYLHQMLMGMPVSTEIDHANGDKLDNRKENLRLCTHAQNNQNRGLRSDSTTGFKGVSFNKRTGRYIAYINADRKRTYLGCYDDKTDAARAYDRAALRLHGEFARPNLPEEVNAYEPFLEVGAERSARSGRRRGIRRVPDAYLKRHDRRRELV